MEFVYLNFFKIGLGNQGGGRSRELFQEFGIFEEVYGVKVEIVC